MSKIIKKCKNCGSENISRDAWIMWNVDQQDWIINDIFDEIYCFDCEETSKEVLEEIIDD